MLPLVARLARQEISRARLDRQAKSPEPRPDSLPKPENGARIQRDSDNPIENASILMPANARAGIVSSDECVGDFMTCECFRLVAERLQPAWNGFGRLEACVVEIVPPPEAVRLAVPGPSLKTERTEIHRFKLSEQLPFLLPADEVLSILHASDQRFHEQIRLRHEPNSSAISDGFSSGASCSNVHCFGDLSGRQRSSAVP